jgi:hypothetical protein
MLYQIPIGVTGGAWPYRYEKTTGPAWLDIIHENLTFNAGTGTYSPEFGYGVLSGTAPASPSGPDTVTVRVTDMLGSFVDVTFSVTVATTNFVHIDQTNGSDITGNGSLANPFQTVHHVNITAPAVDKIVVVHGSSYTMPAHSVVGTDGWWYLQTGTPSAYISSAGQTIDVDCSNTRRAINPGGKTDVFASGFNFINCGLNDPPPNVRVVHATSPVTRSTWWNLHCTSPVGGTVMTDNPGFFVLFHPGGAGHQYPYFVDCTATDLPDASNGSDMYICFSMRNVLFERNTTTRGLGVNVVHLKDSTQRGTFRAITLIDCVPSQTNIGVGFQDTTPTYDIEVCYCSINTDAGRGAIGANNNFHDHAWLPQANVHFYRNSVKGSIENGLGTLGYPELYVRSNAYMAKAGVFTADEDNLFTAGVNPFDANMRLTGAYRTTYLGLAGAEITAIPS